MNLHARASLPLGKHPDGQNIRRELLSKQNDFLDLFEGLKESYQLLNMSDAEFQLRIFTIPKPFEGHIGVIQRNAIRSWKLLPNTHITIFSNDESTLDFAKEEGIEVIEDIPCNEFGTPYLNHAFARVQEDATFTHFCYSNADIILPAPLVASMIQASSRTKWEGYLGVGRRWNVDITEEIHFDNPTWYSELEKQVRGEGVNGEYAPMNNMDYFLFPQHCFDKDLPPFLIGRPFWDIWFISHARRGGVPVLDLTESVFAIHQNHHYNHVPQARGEKWQGPEGDYNESLLKGMKPTMSLMDATHRLTSAGVIKANNSPASISTWLSNLPVLFPDQYGWMYYLIPKNLWKEIRQRSKTLRFVVRLISNSDYRKEFFAGEKSK